MVDRYTGKEMGHIFSLENKYAVWQEIEVLACEAQAELGVYWHFVAKRQLGFVSTLRLIALR